MSDLFDTPDPDDVPRRSPNRVSGSAPLAIALTFTPAEFATLKHNVPGPSGQIGGWQRFENWLVANTDADRRCMFDPFHWMRLTIYYKSEAEGGPNARVRAACGPALARIGIILERGWGNTHNEEFSGVI